MVHSCTCQHCGVLFEARAADKKYCTKEHYFASKDRCVTKTCEACGEQFTTAYRFRGQKTCGAACAGLLTSKRLKTRELKQCLSCGRDFSVTQSYKDKGKYCSLDCFYKHKYQRDSAVVTLICETCKKEFVKPFIKRNRRFCSKSCANTGEHNGMFAKPSPMRGKKAWNNGETVKTNPVVAQLGKKISAVMKQQFESGLRTHRGTNNPNHGNTSNTLTPEKRKRFSEAAINRVLVGVSGYKTGHVTGVYACKKSPTHVKFKSSWELAVMMWWDQNKNVASYEYEPSVITLDDGCRAIPDFFVTYVDGTKECVEIKPTAIQRLPVVAERLLRIRSAVEARGASYVTMGNEEIAEIKRDLGKEFVDVINSYKSGRENICNSRLER